MILRDLHVHTTYCDGKNTPEEMVRAALDLNMKTIGFSVHGFTEFDERYCIPKEKIETYKIEIAMLKEKYRDKIEILCGVEKDYFSKEDTSGYDYVIGSVHYVKIADKYFSVDESKDAFKAIGEEQFGGDFILFGEEYFKNVADVINRTKADIIGHFDVISKYNEGNRFFNEENPRYVEAGLGAIERLIKSGKPFEINTGAVSRGHRTDFYPNEIFLREIARLGGRVVLSSDSHRADTLCYGFDEAERIARDMGLKL